MCPSGGRRSWVRIPPGACSYSVVSMVVTRGRRTQRSGNDRAEELHHGSRRSRDAYRLLFPNLSTSVVARYESGLMPAGHRFHEECQGVLETFEAGRLTLEVSQTHDDQLVRRNNQRVLASGTKHVVSPPGHGEQGVSIDPEEPAIDRTMIGGPGGSDGAHELHETLLQESLAAPHALLQVEIPQLRPVPRGRQFGAK